MEKYIKIKPKMLMKTIAIILITIMILQLFPAIVFGIQQDIALENNTTVESNETEHTENNETTLENKQEENLQNTVTELENKQEERINNNQEEENFQNSITQVDNTQMQSTQNTISEENVQVENNELKIKNDNSEPIVGEIVEKRTLNQKHFLQENGNILTTIYPSNIHYEEKGQLVDIDNSLEEINEDGGIYKNKGNSFEVKFAKKSNKNNLVKLKIKDHNIKWSLKNSNKVNATKTNNNDETKEKLKLKNISSGTVKYSNILEGIDLEYNIISNSIKENIVLNNKTAIEQQIIFEFNTDNLKMEKTETGKIIFTEKNREEVLFFFNVPYMYDAKNEMSEEIELKLEEKNGGKYVLTVIPNKQWLENEEREYPIIIDPTVETSLNYENIQDTYIFNGDTGYPTRHEAHILRVGSNNKLASKNPTRSLIKFNLPELNAGDQVISAMLDICSYIDTNEWTPPTGTIQIDVHKMTQDWNAPTASWNNLSDKYDTRITDYAKYQYDTNNPAKFYYFNITSIVKDWYVTGNNYGLVLKDHTEIYNAPHSDAYFFSADINRQYINARPMVQIEYRNQTGLETYQTYHTQEVGRAGTIHTNDYNGNLTLLHPDACTPGQNLSVSVNHVYNTNDKDINIGYGNGFRLNLSQTIEKVTIGSKEYAKYTDEDGTKHYFEKNGNSYIDSENLKLTLKFENDIFTLTDNSNNKFIFNKKTSSTGEIWHLSQSVDANNNTINITLLNDSTVGAIIEKVTDSSGDSINFTYSNNKLIKITDKAAKSTNYEYDNNGNLVKITYSDAKYSEYTYSNKLLTSVKNIDNSHIDYEYHNEKSNRVKSIKEYGTNNTLGNTISISYGDNITKFTDNTGYSNTYTFNNFGQTISISDFGKDPNDTDNAYGKMYKYGEEQKNKNRLTLDGNLISIGEKENNLVENGNFANGLTNWTKINCDDNDKVENGSFKFIGNSNIDKNIGQTINISGKKGDIFTLATWVNSKAVPNDGNRAIKISLTIHFARTNGTTQIIDKNVNVDGSGWQFKSEVVMPDSDYSSAKVYLVCSYDENETYFDNIGLFKEEFGISYTYDDSGNIVTTESLATGKTEFENINNNMTTKFNLNGTKYKYEYDYLNPTKLLYAKNSLGNKYSFKYDSNGNMIQSRIDGGSELNTTDISTQRCLKIADSEKVFEIESFSTQNGTPLKNNYYTGLNNQYFKISKVEDNYYTIQPYHASGMLLEIDSNNNIIQNTSNNNDTQKWGLEVQDDLNYKIYNKAKGKEYCITLDDITNNLVVSKDEGKLSQRIVICNLGSTTSENEMYDELLLESNEVYRIKAKNSNLYLEATENGNVIQKSYERENTNQLWRVTRLNKNIYKISNLSSPAGYTITANHDVEGEEIKLNDNTDDTRKWKIYRTGNNTYQLQTNLSNDGRYLTIKENSNNNGEKTVLNTKNNLDNQTFIFENTNMFRIETNNHYYRIRAKCSNLYLGIGDDMIVEQQIKDENNAKQKWIIRSNSDGTYRIYSIATMVPLSMQMEDYFDNNSKILVQRLGYDDDDMEIVAREDGTFCIKPISKQENYAFDISNSSTAEGIDVTLNLSNDTSAQKFYLEDAGFVEGNDFGLHIESTAQYSDNGKYQTKSIDESENSTEYAYNNLTGTLSNEKLSNGAQLIYTYDEFDRLTKVELKDQEGSILTKNEYTYQNDKIKKIVTGTEIYEFIYDDFGNLKQVKIGNETIVTKNYEDNNGNLTQETFGNNQSILYTYDRFNRITKKQGTNGSYTYTYNADSNIKSIVDNINNNTKNFTYDLAQRLVKQVNSNGFTIQNGYDINNNINNKKYSINNNEKNVKYNFDSYNRLNSIIDANNIWKRQNDTLSRISKNIIENQTGKYETIYQYIDTASNKTTTYINKIINGNNKAIEYTYNNMGNIETIKIDEGIVNYYYYDQSNRLVRENNKQINKTITYTYDSNGNILNKKEYQYTTSSVLPTTASKTITYTYGNTNWKDQLTSYDGKQITYDSIGNPLTYDGNTYTWQDGNKLQGITNDNNTITYKYDENGIRTQKNINGITTNYYLDEAKVIFEQTGNNIIYYNYDENGYIIGLNYNGTQYYYIKNAQNDIIGILDSSFNQIVTYSYDSWGNTISIKDANGNEITDNTNIGIINPYRYREYRYDSETGLYYLQSRYYNPEWGRFISADNYGGTIGEIYSHNRYAYCKNNPVNMVDEDGNLAIFTTAIFAIFVVAVIGTIAQIPQETWTNLGETVTTIATGITEAVSSGISNITTKKENKINIKTSIKSNTKIKKEKKDIVFPVNPDEFNPKGLKKVEYTGTKNGRIIKWQIGGVAKFEWNEDLQHGSHYHITPFGKHIGIGNIHFKALQKIPEPYKSIYFY